MTDTGEVRRELRRTYFDRALRGWLVDLVAACLEDLPGSEDSKGASKESKKERYASDVLDPFFQRLAETCVENRPEDLRSYMLTWVMKQQGPEPEGLRQFVITWLGQCTGKDGSTVRNPSFEKIEDLLQELEALKAKHEALVDALSSTGLGICMLQKLAEGPKSFTELGLPKGCAGKEPLKIVQQRLDQAESIQLELNDQSSERDKALQALQEQIAALQVEGVYLRKENENLHAEIAKLKDALTCSQWEAQNALLKEPPKLPQGRPMVDCINLILEKLMSDPVNKVSTASQAWAFFEPDDTNQVDSNHFQAKISGLDILTQDEIVSLLEYVDYGASGSVDYGEWKAGLMMALAASGDLHALPTEEEFNAVMFRIKAKLVAKGMTPKEAFGSCDFDNSAELSHDEFMQGMLKLQLGLSKKEITQLFFSMDADQGGMLDLEELEDAIEEGAEADTMKGVVTPVFKTVGKALIRKSCLEECERLASPVGSHMLSFDGFVQLMRIGHPDMTLSSIMRLWCIVDKCGQGGIGFANIPDLVSNILAATAMVPNIKPAAEAA